MERHDPVRGSDQLAADEHGRHRRLAAQQLHQRLLHLRTSRVLVQLMDGSIDAKLMEQALHAVAEAAGAPAEDDHSSLRSQLRHLVHPRMLRLSVNYSLVRSVLDSLL
ncbi:unnamed protein product, partial [Musa acuminata var. zebrina]